MDAAVPPRFAPVFAVLDFGWFLAKASEFRGKVSEGDGGTGIYEKAISVQILPRRKRRM